MSASKAIEDYLKCIYKLEDPSQTEKGVHTSAIASRLNVAQASVSNMIKKLSDQGFVSYEPYYGVALTTTGRQLALQMIRRHRVIEQYLVERLHYAWDEVDAEAEVLEHAVSDKLVDAMWEALGRPTHDPHGSPIPDQDGIMSEQPVKALVDVAEGEQVKLARIKNRSPEELRYLTSIGLAMGEGLRVKTKAPFNGPIMLEINNELHALDYRIAQALMVERQHD
ncbi:metal-dependent transcriptional regulator [Thiomicrospira sp. ALE5]|uniref:metal-dependent transcriptional regulator n=1 Tax=Thiomicrospira sp. ALE5 TaxID=748650 RepID=UPI0008E0F926|nr:metal-dependent transcriptional regulator [Thiomicrospira sp. ALE5]SFR50694.1 iron (metal) dependent repressor, DtxR family [Thiomicrospira sp. ALE5]